MKKLATILLAGAMVLGFTACGNGGGSGGDGDSESEKTVKAASSDPVYTVGVATLDPNVYPDSYPLIASGDFEAAFKNLTDANMRNELNTYEELVEIFGVDGAYYENCDMDYSGQMYKYYGWYAENGISVLITFKMNGNNMKYFAYTGNGISYTGN